MYLMKSPARKHETGNLRKKKKKKFLDNLVASNPTLTAAKALTQNLCIDIHNGEQVPEYFCIYVRLHFQHILSSSLYTLLWVHFLKTTLVNNHELKSTFFSLTFF